MFIWFAENIGTATHAWVYPNQHKEWIMIPFEHVSRAIPCL
ncbi:MAG: DUF817 family protein [Betaproteobacteria bacterium]|nr:DUF817 family protein [Betaproteobacteria bacterium]